MRMPIATCWPGRKPQAHATEELRHCADLRGLVMAKPQIDLRLGRTIHALTRTTARYLVCFQELKSVGRNINVQSEINALRCHYNHVASLLLAWMIVPHYILLENSLVHIHIVNLLSCPQ